MTQPKLTLSELDHRRLSISSMPGPPKHVTVIGGGLTGLTTAFKLSRQLPKTSKIVIVEKEDRIGGWIGSTKHTLADGHGDIVLESGPRSIRPRGGPGAVRMLKLVSSVYCFHKR